MSKHILIVGASRGIGLGLAREFKSRGWDVTATERSKSEDLHALEGVTVQTLDIADPSTFAVDGEYDAVILNAGISGAKHQSSEQATACVRGAASVEAEGASLLRARRGGSPLRSRDRCGEVRRLGP